MLWEIPVFGFEVCKIKALQQPINWLPVPFGWLEVDAMKAQPMTICRWRNWPRSSFTGPRQWLRLHIVQGNLSDPAFFLHLHVLFPWLYILSEQAFLACVHGKLLQLRPTLCNTTNYSLPGSSVHGMLQARILEWVSMPFSKDLSNPGIELAFPGAPTLQVDSLPHSHQGSPFP